jgi:hypothetical protein
LVLLAERTLESWLRFPGRAGVWRTKIDGKYHYLSGVGRYEKPLAGSGKDAIPVKVWDWLRETERLTRAASAAPVDPTVYWLAVGYLKWAESEVEAGRMVRDQWTGQRSRLKLLLDFPGVSETRATAMGVETVAAFFESLQGRYSDEYIAGIGRTICTVFRWGARPIPGRSPLRLLTTNPLDGYRFPRAAPSRGHVDAADVRRFLRWAWARARQAPGGSMRFDRLFLYVDPRNSDRQHFYGETDEARRNDQDSDQDNFRRLQVLCRQSSRLVR